MLNGIKGCKKCPLYKDMSFGPIIGHGTGPLFIIVDNPSESDASVDNLLSDHLGILLNKLLQSSEIKNYYVSGLIKCASKIIKVSHIKSCKDWLISEIDNIKPKCLLILGSNIYKYLHKYKIGQNIHWITTKSLKEIFRLGQQEYDLALDSFKTAKEISIGKLYP